MVRVADDRDASESMACVGRKVAELSFSEQQIADAYRQVYEDVSGPDSDKVSGSDRVKGEIR